MYRSLLFLAFLSSAFAETNVKNIIYKDVVVLGTEAAGLYTAIRLQQEGRKVVVITSAKATDKDVAPELASYTRDEWSGLRIEVNPVLDIPWNRQFPDDKHTQSVFKYLDIKTVTEEEEEALQRPAGTQQLHGSKRKT